MNKIILALSMLILASCGGQRIKVYSGEPLIPELTHLEGVRQIVSVGDVMTSSAPLVIIEKATLQNKLTASTTHRNNPIKLEAEPGIYNLVRQNANGKFYEASNNLVKMNNKTVAGGFFLANNEAINPSLYWSGASAYAMPGMLLRAYIADLDETPKVIISKSKQPPNNANGFVSTLTYTGRADGQIKFVYREFSDGFARAAFTQEISLDYIEGKTYSYKTARFLIHKASISEVEFTLLQSL